MVRLTEEELKKRVWKLLSDSIGDNHPVDFLEERGYSVVHKSAHRNTKTGRHAFGNKPRDPRSVFFCLGQMKWPCDMPVKCWRRVKCWLELPKETAEKVLILGYLPGKMTEIE